MSTMTEVPANAMHLSAASADKKEQRLKASKIQYPFWFGGSAASVAACVTHPLDVGMSRYLPSLETH
ncbi:MAG: hypothetical protein CMP47_14250 [Rickettsiales bacterium]|nr:hypothetical protein [Rickettsiales bacterium]